MLLLTVLSLSVATVAIAGVDEDCGIYGKEVPAPPPGARLVQVHAIIRHGDRTPWSGSSCWPNDTSTWSCSLESASIPMYSDDQYGETVPRVYRKVFMIGDEEMRGNCSVGQLTRTGFSQQKLNGQSLGKAYVQSGFLGSKISPAEIYIRSDDVPRTIQSAESLMLGMYPTTDSGTEVVELHTADTTLDYMQPNAVLCPRYGVYFSEFNTTSMWKKHYEDVTKPLFQKLSQASNFTVDMGNFGHLVDCLVTHKCHKLPWPRGMTEDLQEQADAENAWQFFNAYKYPNVTEMSVVGIGFLLKEMWMQMVAAVGGSPAQKFLLYSGHDTTLIPMLVALQVDTGVWPPYGSMILLELYELGGGDYSVRMIYNGHVLTMPFCGSSALCDFNTFSKYMQTATPSDPKKQCSTSSLKL